MTLKEFSQTDISLGITSVLLSFVSGVWAGITPEMVAAETNHLIFLIIGAVAVFVLNKVLNYLWTKFIKKKSNENTI